MSMASGDLLLDRFRLVRVLGEHGSSRSWLAEDAEPGESVVLRVLAPELAASQLGHERLRDACRQARRLHHPQIVHMHDFHREGELCFVSREFVEAADPAEPLPPELRSAQLAGVADALAYAHGLGVAHGDLKSAKVIWGRDGIPRVADFCVAAELSRAARALGPPTPGPEPEAPGPADDVRGLGAIFFEVWTGEAPAPSETSRCAARLEACGAESSVAVLVEEMLAPTPGDRPEMDRVRSRLDPSAGLSRPTPVARASGSDPGTPDVDDDIVPVPVKRRPAPPLTPARKASSPAVPRSWLLGAFAILLAMALGVFVYLPRLVDPKVDDDSRAAASGSEATLPVAKNSAARSSGVPSETGAAPAEATEDAAKRLLAELLELHETLLSQGVRQWAPKKMRESEVGVEQGDRFLIGGDFGDAVARYTEAKSIADALLIRAPEELGEALAAGVEALDAGQDEQAARHFELALAIDSENEAARAGLERAASLDEVAALLASARRHEEAGELALARERYVEAQGLDSASVRAKEGVARVDARRGEIAYGSGMSVATRALAAGDFAKALTSVDKALAARPGSSEAKSLRARIQSSRKRNVVAVHQSRALALERDGSFALAVEQYRKALEIDAELATAQQGLARSEQGLRLSRAFAGWIAEPDRLLEPRARDEASGMLIEAGAFPSLTDGMKQQAAQVETLLARFSQPVRVVFESDDVTDVTIQRLSKLGSFTRREVELDPGTYVVLGIRRGYRDVRQTITVAPGQVASPVVIRCTQPI
jgi:serine/threonine protein kinase